MGDPFRTSAANIEEGNEVKIGGRWQVVEDAQSDGEITILWVEECQYVFNVGDQLTVCK
jgi:hypothetical protein